MKGRLVPCGHVGDCRAHHTTLTYHIEKLQERHQQKIPWATGEYAINIIDESGPFVIKEKPIVLGTVQ